MIYAVAPSLPIAVGCYGEEFIVGFKAGVVFDKWYRNLNYP